MSKITTSNVWKSMGDLTPKVNRSFERWVQYVQLPWNSHQTWWLCSSPSRTKSVSVGWPVSVAVVWCRSVWPLYDIRDTFHSSTRYHPPWFHCVRTAPGTLLSCHSLQWPVVRKKIRRVRSYAYILYRSSDRQTYHWMLSWTLLLFLGSLNARLIGLWCSCRTRARLVARGHLRVRPIVWRFSKILRVCSIVFGFPTSVRRCFGFEKGWYRSHAMKNRQF